jgi:uncharacterized protein
MTHISWVTLIVFGDFEWDSEKAESNLRVHGVSFVDAAAAVADPLSVEVADHTPDERRVDVIGSDATGRILFVVTIDRGPRIRIISARRAEPTEIRRYRDG